MTLSLQVGNKCVECESSDYTFIAAVMAIFFVLGAGLAVDLCPSRRPSPSLHVVSLPRGAASLLLAF